MVTDTWTHTDTDMKTPCDRTVWINNKCSSINTSEQTFFGAIGLSEDQYWISKLEKMSEIGLGARTIEFQTLNKLLVTPLWGLALFE
jgi:hypothetical protein